MNDSSAFGIPPRDAELEALIGELLDLRAEMVAAVAEAAPVLASVHPTHRASARNLLHYLAFRSRDRRSLQSRLNALGLSSFGAAESHVLGAVDAVLHALHALAGMPDPHAPAEADGDPSAGHRTLADNTDALFGPAPGGRTARIMVTVPRGGAEDHALVHDLLKQGMDCLRINCARDDAAAWEAMIGHVRTAERSLQRPCRILMDLSGPKLRTAPLHSESAVLRVRPRRDAFGNVRAPARVWLTAVEQPVAPPSPSEGNLQVAGEWLARLQVGDRVGLVDARGSKRSWKIVDVAEEGCWAEARKTTYLVPETVLRHTSPSYSGMVADTPVSGLPSRDAWLPIATGDTLLLTRDQKPGRPAKVDDSGRVLVPACIGCTLPEVFDDVQPGESVWFDDGVIGGVIERVEASRLVIRVTRTPAGGARLRSDRGINLPDSQLRLAALTDKDLQDLAFAVRHADMVALSFVNRPGDVELLLQHMARLGPRQPAVVVKIETRRALESLPAILLAAMRAPCCGVILARGDLAVECGFERLAKAQEDILSLCEAAHLPVIWATQVLQSLTSQGQPSRPEVTDASAAARAECVLLNRGRHVVPAVQMLDHILQQMQERQRKNQPLLPALHWLPAAAARDGEESPPRV